MIVKETNQYLRNIKCPFCDCEYVQSDSRRPLGNTNFTSEICKECGKTFWWSRKVQAEYTVAVEE